jgi:hypothetical protein
MASPAYAPERTQPEVTEGHAEAEGEGDASRPSFAGLVLKELAPEGDAANARHRKENKARNFQPELVQNASERAQGGPSGLHYSAYGTTSPGLLARDVGKDAELAG